MRLLIDMQLPLQLAIHLRRSGHDWLHLIDTHLKGGTDVEVWELAKLEQRIVVSKDEDFVFLANNPLETGRLIWVRIGNCRNATLLKAFDQISDELQTAFAAGERIVEVR